MELAYAFWGSGCGVAQSSGCSFAQYSPSFNGRFGTLFCDFVGSKHCKNFSFQGRYWTRPWALSLPEFVLFSSGMSTNLLRQRQAAKLAVTFTVGSAESESQLRQR